MFEIEFYEDARGVVEIADYLDELKEKAVTSKDARIKRQKILAYMAALQEKGTLLGEPFIKHIENDLWELRPLNNRVFFFYWRDNTYVMLHHFVKKTKKIPKKEIDKAKSNRDDWLERKEHEKSNEV